MFFVSVFKMGIKVKVGNTRLVCTHVYMLTHTVTHRHTHSTHMYSSMHKHVPAPLHSHPPPKENPRQQTAVHEGPGSLGGWVMSTTVTVSGSAVRGVCHCE